jgi:hypothetical protein
VEVLFEDGFNGGVVGEFEGFDGHGDDNEKRWLLRVVSV